MSQLKRWIPAGVVSVVIAGVAIAVPLSANASGPLADGETPQSVLSLAANSSVEALSGTIQQTSNLGLPELPTSTGGAGSSAASGADAGASSALELLTGTHTARVFVDGPTNLRLQVLDQLAERDVVRGGSDVWAYDSSKQTAVHTTLPSGGSTDAASGTPTPDPTSTATPDQLAKKFLDAVTPSTEVTLGNDVTIAGRSAHDLVLTPSSTDTLVGTVSIAVDSSTGLPLRVSVTARGASDPAFTSEFTQIDYSTPSADLFSFAPPAGTAVTEETLPTKDQAAAHGDEAKARAASAPKPTVTGTGWDAIVSVPASGATTANDLTSNPLFAQLTTPVAGGHLLSTSLVNVLLTDDGRVFAGSVSAAQLEAAAAAPAATK